MLSRIAKHTGLSSTDLDADFASGTVEVRIIHIGASENTRTERFARWVADVFGRSPSGWYPKDPDFGEWSDLAPHEVLGFLTRALDDPSESFGHFDDDSIAQGLLFIVHPRYTNWAATLLDEDLPLPDRARGIDGIVTFFRRFVAERPTPSKNLASIIYMWWDLFPSWGSEDAATDSALLDAMSRILDIENLLCQDSALHGLNHWQTNYPREVSAIIDAYLARNPGLGPELVHTARAAQKGAIQ
jgi:hypothetical protein